MHRTILRRIGSALLLVFLVSSGALLLTGLSPGDMTTEQVGGGASAMSIAAERARLGLDRPIAERYLDWLVRAARLDFGTSLLYGRPVAALVAERVLNTALLACVALFAATLFGLPLGVIAGSTRRPVIGALVRGTSLLALSMPSLLTSLVLVFVAARTGWLPLGGMTSLSGAGPGLGARLADVGWHLILPATALAVPIGAMIERLQAQSLARTLQEPFIAAVAARGATARRIVWRHALKPSLRPLAAIYGMILGSLLSGSFIVEIITAWPGLGRLMYDALRARDLYLAAGCAAAGGAFLAFGGLVSDVALGAIDPRAGGLAERSA